MTVYVLRCREPLAPGEEDTNPIGINTYYIGWSNNVDRRFREHRGEYRGKRDRHLGAEFTQRYYPMDIIETRIGSLRTENEVTLEYMAMYGVDAVRGGVYAALHLGADQLAEIARYLAAPICARCGEHSPADCPLPRTPTARAPYYNPIAQSKNPAADAALYLRDMTPAKARHIAAAATINIADITADSDPAAAARAVLNHQYGTVPAEYHCDYRVFLINVYYGINTYIPTGYCSERRAAAIAILERIGARPGDEKEFYRNETPIASAEKLILQEVFGMIIGRGTHPSRSRITTEFGVRYAIRGLSQSQRL